MRKLVGWIWSFLKDNGILKTFLLGTLVAGLFLLPNIIANQGYLQLWGDYNYQQIPFYLTAHDTIRSGHFLWNFTTDLGVDFIGTYAFYLLGSPFFWFTLLFPATFVPYLMGPLMALKFGCATAAAYALLKRFVSDGSARVGGLLYAFSGFAITTLYWNHFLEPIILFPLLILALDHLVLERKRGWFLGVVFLALLQNYAFFIGDMVFLLLYLIINLRTGRYVLDLRDWLDGVFETVLGIGLGMFLLLPALMGAMGSGRTGFSFDLKALFGDVPAMVLFPVGFLFALMGLVALLLTFRSIRNMDRKMRVRLLAGIGVGLLLLMAALVLWIARSPAGSGQTALAEVLGQWFFYRNDVVQHIITSLFLPPEIQGRLVFVPNSYTWAGVSLGLPIVGIVGIIAFFRTLDPKNRFIKYILGVSGIFAIIPLLNSSFTVFTGEYYARWFYMPILFMVLATVIAMEKANKKDWMVGLTVSGGITLLLVAAFGLLPKTVDGVIQIGRYDYAQSFRFWSMGAIGLGSVVLVYLWIRYAWGWETGKKLRWTTGILACFIILHGTYFISQGTASTLVQDRSVSKILSHRDLLGWDVGLYRIDYPSPYDNLSLVLNRGGIKSFNSIVSSSVLPLYKSLGNERTGVTTTQSYEQYGYSAMTSVKYFISSDPNKVPVQGFDLLYRFDGYAIYRNDNFLPLGIYYDAYVTEEEYLGTPVESRDRLLVKALVLEEDSIQGMDGTLAALSKAELITLDEKSVEAVIFDKQQVAGTTVFNGNSFETEISLPRDGAVMYSIPWKSGWTARVNGREVTVEKVNYGLMAVMAKAGDNFIELSYDPPEWKIGWIVSTASLVLTWWYLRRGKLK